MILAFESSCDDTCVAITDGTDVQANIISSQIELHRKTQGVVPEVAARAHAVNVFPVLEACLQQAQLKLSDITAIAASNQPGMVNCLLVGTTVASSLAALLNLPLIEVDHKLGHVYSCFLDRDRADFKFPIVVLSVSGGHNELYLIREIADHQLLGHTLDDAAGEAYDKVAKMLGLNYPGGPEIAKQALKGNPSKYQLPSPLPHQKLNFSFSGLKTNLKNLIARSHPLNAETIADIAASFQHTINQNLVKKTANAVSQFQAKEVHLVGGVSANLDLREKMQAAFKSLNLKTAKSFDYCTDNAAMIAGAANLLSQNNGLKPGSLIRV